MRFFCYAMMIFAIVVGTTGCFTPPPPDTTSRGNPQEPGMTTTSPEMYDYDLVVKKMVEGLVKRLEPKDGRTPVITFGPVENKTPYGVDAQQILSDIRIDILKTDKAEFSGATDLKQKDGKYGELVNQLQTMNSKLMDPESAKQIKETFGVDYIIYGQVTSQQVAGKDQAEVTYQFNLNLFDLETSRVVWADKRRIRKNLPLN